MIKHLRFVFCFILVLLSLSVLIPNIDTKPTAIPTEDGSSTTFPVNIIDNSLGELENVADVEDYNEEIEEEEHKESQENNQKKPIKKKPFILPRRPYNPQPMPYNENNDDSEIPQKLPYKADDEQNVISSLDLNNYEENINEESGINQNTTESDNKNFDDEVLPNAEEEDILEDNVPSPYPFPIRRPRAEIFEYASEDGSIYGYTIQIIG